MKISSLGLALIGFFSLLTQPAQAAKAKKLPEYRVGVHFGLGANQDADLAAMHKELLARMGKSLKVKFVFEPYSSQEELDLAIQKKQLDIVQAPVGGLSTLLTSLDNGYQPLGQLSIDNKNAEKLCLYRKKDKKKFDLKKLKDKKAVISPDPVVYFLLREILQAPPEDYFVELKPVSSAFSGFFALTLGEAEVTLANQTIFNALKVINPGPVKNLEEVFCSATKLPMAMALTKNSFPAPLKKSIMTIVTQPEKHPTFKPFISLIKQFKLKAIPVKGKDYSELSSLFKEAKKKGWDKDFKRWQKSRR